MRAAGNVPSCFTTIRSGSSTGRNHDGVPKGSVRIKLLPLALLAALLASLDFSAPASKSAALPEISFELSHRGPTAELPRVRSSMARELFFCQQMLATLFLLIALLPQI